MLSTNQNKISHKKNDLFKNANHILNTRSLEKNHERLSKLLKPGMTVLDIGCGPGSITRGIAKKVAPNGQVVGVDLNRHLIAEARNSAQNISNLSFEVGNIYDLPCIKTFDLIVASRIFHWLEQPLKALETMAKCVKPGGRVIVHEPNLEKLIWQPNPPNSFKAFYNAFLEWRTETRMDNTIGDKLSKMFEDSGFVDVIETPQLEISNSTDSDFETHIGIWSDIMAIQGPLIVKNGLISERQIFQARKDYREWAINFAKHQTVYFIAVDATLPI